MKIVILPTRSEINKAICSIERGAENCEDCNLDCRNSREDIIAVLDTVYSQAKEIDIDALYNEFIVSKGYTLDGKGIGIPVKFSDFIKEKIGK